MRSARLSAAFHGWTFAVALAATSLPAVRPAAQEPVRRFRGAILVQAVDTSINPIRAEITMPAFEVAARGNDDGLVFFVDVPDGLYVLRARHLGHRPEWRFARVTGDTVRMEIVLAPAEVGRGAAAALAEWRLREFLRRTTAIPFGTFIGRGQIERRRPRTVLALLSGVKDVVVDYSSGGPPVVRSQRAPAVPHCAAGMLVFVDAAVPPGLSLPELREAPEGDRESSLTYGRLSTERRAGGRGPRWKSGRQALGASAIDYLGGEPGTRDARGIAAGRTASLLERMPVGRVAALEVYPTIVGVPEEFRVTGVECGALLIWTVAEGRRTDDGGR